MDEKTEDKIHNEGMDAYEAGKGPDACPYRKNSEKADIWKHGWDTAFELESMEE
jgi:ribosome modulation factor